MLSRVAENIYWLARYVERAENTARLIRVNTQLNLDTPKHVQPGWEALITITGMKEAFDAEYDEPTERNVVKFLVGADKSPGSILHSLIAARENCRTVREILPRSAWEALNELYLYGKDNLQKGVSKKGRDDYLNEIIAGSQRFVGLMGSILYRDAAYHFSRIGRNLERADMTTRILDVRSTNLFDETSMESSSLDTIQWISVLRSLSGYQSYRRKVQIRVNREAALSFLLKDMQFPRSVQHCLLAVEESLGDFVNNRKTLHELRLVSKAVWEVDTSAMSKNDIHSLMDELQCSFIKIHDALYQAYFEPRKKGEIGALMNGDKYIPIPKSKPSSAKAKAVA